MKVAEYRQTIDGLSDAFASLQSAATPQERISEADRVKRWASELMNAECKRSDKDDREQAERLIDRTASYLINAGLAGKPVCTCHPIVGSDGKLYHHRDCKEA